MMLTNAKHEVFVGQRIDIEFDAWQMPQGGVDAHETDEEAVMRELKEEIGTNQAEILARSSVIHTYDLPAHLIPKLWEGKYRGQAQIWFLLRFTGTDADISIMTETPEFSHWKWVSLAGLTEIIVPFKRKMYNELIREFQPILLS